MITMNCTTVCIEAAVQHVRGCKFVGTCIYRGGNGKAQLVNNNTTH